MSLAFRKSLTIAIFILTLTLSLYSSPASAQSAPGLPEMLTSLESVQLAALEWADIRTASKRITFNNAGNLGHGGQLGYSLDFFNDCDTANNVQGADDNARTYLYDASPFILRVKGNDTILDNYIWNADPLGNIGFCPLGSLTIDSSGGPLNYPVASDPTWQITGLNYARTGKFLTKDSVIGLDCEYFMPMNPDSSDFMVQKVSLFKNINSGDTLRDVMIGELMDWDIPSDSGVDNGSNFDVSRRMMYCYGGECGPDTGALAPWNDCILADDRAGGFAYLRGYYVSDRKRGIIPGTPPMVPTDTVAMKGMFTGSNANWQGGTGNFLLGALRKKLWKDGFLFSGYEPWFSASGDPDSTYINLNMVAFYGSFKMGPKDTLVFIKILATTRGQQTGKSLGAIVDEARTWIQGRRGVGNCCNLPGDVNNNGIVQATDVTYLIGYLYKFGLRPQCMAEADANGDGVINASDITRLINKLYKPTIEPALRIPVCPR